MAYPVNAYQAERIAAALAAIHAETVRYLDRMSGLLTEALDEECGNGPLEADALADVISDSLHDTLKDAVAAVRGHYEIESPASFPRLSPPRPSPRLALKPERGEIVRHYAGGRA